MKPKLCLCYTRKMGSIWKSLVCEILVRKFLVVESKLHRLEPMFYVQTPFNFSRFWSWFHSLNSPFCFASLYKNITTWIYVLCWLTWGWCEFYRSKRSIVREILKTFHSNILILNLTSWAASLSACKFILWKLLSSFCAVMLGRGARLIKHCGWVLYDI